MSEKRKTYSFKCKGCGEDRTFVDQGVEIEETSTNVFRVHQPFDPDFPGTIRCGNCGDTFQYQAGEVSLVEPST